MKFLSVFVLLAVAVCYIRAQELSKENVQAVMDTCKDEEGATDDDVEAMKLHQPAGSKEAKCLRACVMKKFGLMNDDGKMVRDVAIEIGKFLIKDEDKKDMAVAIVDACEPLEVDDDHCEAAVQYGDCIKEHIKEHGLASEEL